MDPRVKKLADLLIRYSLGLKKGQILKIQGEVATLPLITAVYERALDAGAYPYTKVLIPQNEEYLLKHGNDAQIGCFPPAARLEVRKIDAYLSIWGAANTRYLSGVNPRKQAVLQKAKKPLMDTFFKRAAGGDLRWCGTQFPTEADAQDADMSLADYMEFVFDAGQLNRKDPVAYWRKVGKDQDRLVRILKRSKHIHVLAPDTDLQLRVGGRKWISCDGHENFPDGEIFTSPIENSAEGVIRYTFPAVYLGREVENVRLEFKKGKVVSERTDKNGAFLREMLNTDRGARYLGEFAIGTNYGIKRFSRNTLFDEKIGGTCHLAVGASYPETGGKNKSAIHWDMVCNLKKDSEIRADGKVIYRNGKFTI